MEFSISAGSNEIDSVFQNDVIIQSSTSVPCCTVQYCSSNLFLDSDGLTTFDPLSLDIFAKEGILCLSRAKRRNLERLILACGGSPIHSLHDMEESQLGYAGKVSPVTLGEDKFTFVEDCGEAKSCTLLLQGPNEHSITEAKDAVKDGMRALKNALEDKAVIPGGGAFETVASLHLTTKILPTVMLGIYPNAGGLGCQDR
jgi:T-complex protein 1 subunit zeta